MGVWGRAQGHAPIPQFIKEPISFDLVIMDCSLCLSLETHLFAQLYGRDYWRCSVCHLTFVDRAQFLAVDEEKKRYLHHQNDPTDGRYRAWLAQVSDVLLPKLPTHSHGLDFGSGPGPTLSLMLAEAGHEVVIYDPFFAPDTAVLNQTYDFITCTETAEHFNHPQRAFTVLNRCLRVGGWLGVMTQILDEDGRFANWWYVRDETHVAFYKIETMHWIANHFAWQMEMPRKNVVLFQKK